MRPHNVSPPVIDAVPSKRIYQSIIADYDLSRSICELVDNALDGWHAREAPRPLTVSLTIDTTQKSIRIEDDAGGVARDDLKSLVSPGDSRNTGDEGTIGYFGVGSKRAVVALAMQIRITTRVAKAPGFRVEYDDEWLTAEDNWELSVTRVPGASEGATLIELSRLRVEVDDDAVDRLRAHLSEVYARFLGDGRLVIKVNGEPVTGAEFNAWAFPPDYRPTRMRIDLVHDGTPVTVTVLGGLMRQASPGEGEYGVYVYANDRQIARALKTHDVGFGPGQAGRPHPTASLMRVVVSIDGPARLMPWNSSKSDLNTQHAVFRTVRPTIVGSVTTWATISRRLDGQWSSAVAPYVTGTIVDEVVADPGKPNRSYLPPVPAKRAPRFGDVIKAATQHLRSKKPWVSASVDGIVAVDIILHDRRIDSRNRIAVFLLDSTLEIAFKDYLVNDSGRHYNDSALVALFANRPAVHAEVKKYLTWSASKWKQIEHFYKLRCKLVHERANAGISDETVTAHRDVVLWALKKLFGLKVPTEAS